MYDSGYHILFPAQVVKYCIKSRIALMLLYLTLELCRWSVLHEKDDPAKIAMVLRDEK